PDPDLFYETGVKGFAGGQTAAAAMLIAGLPSTAVISGTDLSASGIMSTLRGAGIRIPLQQAVVGFDDSDEARNARPSLSTVAQDFDAIGCRAAEFLLAQLAGSAVPAGPHVVATRLVTRDSCGCTNASIVDMPYGDRPTDAQLPEHLRRHLTSAMTAAEPLPLSDETARAVNRFAHVFGAAVTAPSETSTWDLREATEQLWPSVRSLGLQLVTSLLRAAVDEWEIATRQTGELPEGLDRTVGQLLLQVSLSLAAEAQRGQFNGQRTLLDSLITQYEVSLDLLRGQNENDSGLAWLSRTTAIAGVLALRGPTPDDPMLTIHSSFHRDEPAHAFPQTFDERSFPPQWLLEAAVAHPEAVVLVIPIEGRASQNAYLAVLAPVDNRDPNGREMFHQWAALVDVALAHLDVLHSLRAQQASLGESLAREQRLAADIGHSEERYALAAAAANDGLWDWDVLTGKVFYSERSLDVLGSRTATGGIEVWLDRVHADDRPGLEATIERQFAGRLEPLDYEHRITTDEGEIRWVRCRGLAVRTDDGLSRIVGSLTDVTERRGLEDRLRRQALYDNLTALPNRALLLDRLGLAVRRTKRHTDYRFAVLFIDLDGFKVINDSLGHATGDKLLLGVASRLQSFVRVGDTAARIGGDEFVVILDDLAAAADVPAITRRLQDALAAPYEIDGKHVVVTVSIGITTTQQEHASAEDMLRDADIAMYRAKTSGRGRQATFDADMRLRLVNRMSIESELRAAVDNGAFELHYQPIVTLDTGHIRSFEALIRWPNGRGGLIPPGDFLPIAEDTGLIVPIGRWVAEETCRQLAEWRASAHPAANVPISINVSNKEFWDAGLLAHLAQVIDSRGLTPALLNLEITEGVIADDAERAGAIVDAMHEQGHSVHIDDFGTGYSSLGALHALRIDALKIDRSFFQAIAGGSGIAELTRAIVK
ncbi:MAG: hypothetical protein QOC73_1147, partial [Actinomycetota bacterium]|nr:hypothetical protein [Actinomycetota bacterium]